ncbi:MAG: hypothetical protein JWP06_165 [Candidatus Saccharibacteria bacterium]|nr:hypothetical protein [Candidatus Saccharibacteria bacterium]
MSAERDRREDDRARRALKRRSLVVVAELVLLVPVDVRRVVRLERQEGHELAADAAVQVERDVLVHHEMLPDLLARLHAVDAADDESLEGDLSGVVLLVDLDALGAELQQVLTHPLHLRPQEVLGPEDEVGGDVARLDEVLVEQDELGEAHRRQRR